MKYFFDTEFIEGFNKPLFGKRRHFIDLISIGIVAEDGREYYAISNEYDFKKADKWVVDNVITPTYQQQPPSFKMQFCSLSTFHKYCGKSNKKIADEIVSFINNEPIKTIGSIGGTHFLSEESKLSIQRGYVEPEFYGYYADYDWVLFCSMFGRMIDLPKGFPMYCKDLKQSLDEAAESTKQIKIKHLIYESNLELLKELPEDSIKDISDWTFDQKLTLIKAQTNFPKQTNEHNALADAKWNYELYKFLNYEQQ